MSIDPVFIFQVVGGIFSLILSVLAIFGYLYSIVVGTPKFIRNITGVNELDTNISRLETKIDTLVEATEMSQQIQLQQAEEFNELSGIVCDEHNVDGADQPYVSDRKIREYLMKDRIPDFTREEN